MKITDTECTKSSAQWACLDMVRRVGVDDPFRLQSIIYRGIIIERGLVIRPGQSLAIGKYCNHCHTYHEEHKMHEVSSENPYYICKDIEGCHNRRILNNIKDTAVEYEGTHGPECPCDGCEVERKNYLEFIKGENDGR